MSSVTPDFLRWESTTPGHCVTHRPPAGPEPRRWQQLLWSRGGLHLTVGTYMELVSYAVTTPSGSSLDSLIIVAL